MEELNKAYDPKATEEKIYQLWEKSGYFNPDKFTTRYTLNAKRYSIHLPPPNITGFLHMGHALNAVIADILIRYHRMKGYRTVWFPGIDHAGIATQNVVEKQLKKEGVSRWDLGREKFLERVWQWKEKYGGIILEQLKKLGASCDWSRVRFTMDPDYAEWVKKSFIHYYEKGLIYRGKRVVSWCPRCQTSLSDLEIEYKPEKTKLWYIRYPLINDPKNPNTPELSEKIVEKDLSYKLTGLFFEVQKELGRFSRERQYADALTKQLENSGLKFTREAPIITADRKSNFADFLVENKVIVELKAKPFIEKDDYYQTLRYLEASGLELALIVNFRSRYLKPKRVLNAKLYKSDFGSFGNNSDFSGRYIIVATTRPETMLGDAAVAVNPNDKRYQKLVGQKVVLPIQNREIFIIADEKIDMTFGTGAVKVTPAHDLLDAEIAERHKLPFYQIIDERGRMTAEAGKEFEGLKVAEARAKVVAELEKLGLIEKTENYEHNLAVCYRCSMTLEPLLSDQWFLRMTSHPQNQKSPHQNKFGTGQAKIKNQKLGMSLRDMALEAVKSGKIKIIPKNFEKVMIDWLENIKDWCISRQIWWGHQIPAWLHELKCVPKKGHEGDVAKCKDIIVAAEKPKCEYCDAEFMQSGDVLDTWFSSALWPFAGLSESDLKEFYPSSVLITARDIINLWVARMIFSGLEFMKEIPFPEVLIHATILTKEGKRMSKSLGTGIDPLELIEKYGADATRFGIIWQAMGTQDIHWDETAVQAGKKFANKLWNIARFVNLQISKSKIKNQKSKLLKEDQEILEKLEQLEKEIEKDILSYELGPALHKIYDFVWHEFADKYIELSKKREDDGAEQVLLTVFARSLKSLHPFMPFITEAINQKLPIEKHGFTA